MPIMIPPKINTKIRFAILGKPGAIQDKKSALLKKISKSLEYESSRLIR